MQLVFPGAHLRDGRQVVLYRPDTLENWPVHSHPVMITRSGFPHLTMDSVRIVDAK